MVRNTYLLGGSLATREVRELPALSSMEWPASSDPDFVEAEFTWPEDIHNMSSKVMRLDHGQQRLSLGAVSPQTF